MDPFLSDLSWPRSFLMTVFMQMANFDNEERDGAKWWQNKAYGRWEPTNSTNEKFTLKDSVAMFSRQDRRFYMTKKNGVAWTSGVFFIGGEVQENLQKGARQGDKIPVGQWSYPGVESR